jgi:predicted negative regulator of RcsB-dependent stress response
MASSLDLQEQEQLDQLKAFWNRWGNLLSWAVTAVLLAFAAYNGWNWWQREQGQKASALHAELERAAQAGETDRVKAAWADLKARYASTAYAGPGALVAAKALIDKGQAADAIEPLQWAAESAQDDGLKAVARLRWAGVLLDQGQAQEALTLLDKARGLGFDALVDDRRGDAFTVLKKDDEAREAYKAAYKAMPPDLDYRRLLEAKLMALGVDPASVVPPPAANAPNSGKPSAAARVSAAQRHQEFA